MSLLVVDVGTSGVRAGLVGPDGQARNVHHIPVLPSTPGPGLVEIARAVLEVSGRAMAGGEAVTGVGIANQRASTVVWDRKTGKPVGPGLGWQDLRTVLTCLEMQSKGFRLAPNASATKLAFLLDEADPDREMDLCFGTIDTWVAWTLSNGDIHVTDASNAGVTQMVTPDGTGWDGQVLEALRIPQRVLPKIVDSSGIVGEASVLAGSPPICGIAGDQQASLIGQGCTRPGMAKATFGTGGMLDCCTGDVQPEFTPRGPAGTFPIVAWQRKGRRSWGVEAMMLSAGSCVEWLRDDLGIIGSVEESDRVASECSGADVWFVPALLGLGTPVWDFGARGTLLGLTRGAGRPQVVRAVLEGVAQRGADLLEAAEGDAGLTVASLRVDGGMTTNRTFVAALADAIGRPVEVSAMTEATMMGAAYLAGIALGVWAHEDEIAETWTPGRVVEPTLDDHQRKMRRERWYEMRERARRTIPDLSGVEF
jgi:glycerol kinase